LNEEYRLLWAEEIGHYADDFEIKPFNLVAGEDRVCIALHSGANLIDGKSFTRLGCEAKR
jgi:hypothetical protein